jgi:predicted enzyme related to lactoylglutathione lyase
MHGKVCYILIPAADIPAAAAFYANVFRWEIRERGDGHLAFDDTTGGVSGAWVLNQPPAGEDGLRVFVMVDSVAATLEAIVSNGGQIHTPIGADAPEITARFRDPYGNILNIYQEPG